MTEQKQSEKNTSETNDVSADGDSAQSDAVEQNTSSQLTVAPKQPPVSASQSRQGSPRQEIIFEKLLDHQTRELEYRNKVLEADKFTKENHHQYALKALDAQSKFLDREQTLSD